jgi:hypothetical protein
MEATEELYDTVDDPDETRNLAAGERERTAAMRERLARWCEERGDTAMLDGKGGLAHSPFDPAQISRLPHQTLGWRPY